MVKCLACIHLHKSMIQSNAVPSWYCSKKQECYLYGDVTQDTRCIHFTGYKSMKTLVEAL